jgi:hypothetical protein
MTTKQDIESVAAQLGLTLTSEFVPFSKSRNAGEKSPTLNWKITLHKDGRPILTTDYGAGCGHCPSYQQGNSNACRAMAVDAECETGYAHRIDGMNPTKTNKPILPDFADVLHSLASDSDVLDCSSFEEWAGNLGYDADSRKAEGIYRACLDVALKLRNALGEQGLATLREACQDY